MAGKAHGLVALFALALPLVAQVAPTVAEKADDAPAVKMDKFWKIETSGIGG